ncbi:SAM-dependent methyltransferase [Endobacter medicaginis]|uniref:SAM-dependent methyltransferase n=1 Tax=Endobacter medicaginis TaxID=1181271 RepID=A0A839V6C4_9PROT|nr:methyltransferase domain-containing protein [Endobacter medicaginis]MBB3175089.1 SAM-dependent methyltransferase [Endobacter medicaginis]MCX5476203.1 methyltransferase domain-containing protein [Endobacter medicaginis]
MSKAAIFDRRAVRLHRDRAASLVAHVAPILDAVAERLLDRLDDTTHRFARALDIGGRGVVAPRLAARGIETISCDLSAAMLVGAPGLRVAADEECLPFAAGSFDLVVASLSLHWVNDLPGTFAQIRHILRPDGLFLAALPVLPTAAPLREALIAAESDLSGGAAPRISPYPRLHDAAALMQRAGFALPVVDTDRLALAWRRPDSLLRDLRRAGETNALRLREQRPLDPGAFAAAFASLLGEDATMPLDLHLAMLTGWAPAPGQPKPLAPGAFDTPLGAALGDTTE